MQHVIWLEKLVRIKDRLALQQGRLDFRLANLVDRDIEDIALQNRAGALSRLGSESLHPPYGWLRSPLIPVSVGAGR
ncbi:hypothetical protein GFB56_30735 [Ensifer sp. T173]|uniref:Uncharacterized protein n=1 Tax=Ensifer canadensis TaxID=555315 RepID=A0AAW4FUW5_9HYPH|nr:hypothetical protein [Ensifer canadensis]MBM3095107.1 hypothetical protein [Ensifer canadensis]UBI80596.1 hypothetical protein J3R84_33510 [Ensifer canadensis]